MKECKKYKRGLSWISVNTVVQYPRVAGVGLLSAKATESLSTIGECKFTNLCDKIVPFTTT